jgi:hypothetical protein
LRNACDRLSAQCRPVDDCEYSNSSFSIIGLKNKEKKLPLLENEAKNNFVQINITKIGSIIKMPQDLQLNGLQKMILFKLLTS